MKALKLSLLVLLLGCTSARHKSEQKKPTPAEGFTAENVAKMTRKSTFKIAKDEILLSGTLYIHEVMPGRKKPNGQPDNTACVYGSATSVDHKNYLKKHWHVNLSVDGQAVELRSRKLTTLTTIDAAGKVQTDPSTLYFETCTKDDFSHIKDVRFDLRYGKGDRVAILNWEAPWSATGIGMEK